ncbi:unnamed protein product [Rotaria socialis]|uniref:CABIT domain-containing protein n=2 Tax=Rotaria socialis TaxID=392032 RepID=A0A821K8Z4_9BILA|nr:unnamed protein product [Rotaria socialis]
MSSMLSDQHILFPNRGEKSYKLNEFLAIVNDNCDKQYELPIIVNITSLNSYGKSIKHLLLKTNAFLLFSISQIDSILAEYHHAPDGNQYIHRNRLAFMQKRTTSKRTVKFQRMKKLSKSLVSLTSDGQAPIPVDDDGLPDDKKNIPYNERTIINNLNQKRPSATPHCRVPMEFPRFFELLNENDKPIQPCHILSELLIIEKNIDDNEKHVEKWPNAFLLRSSCKAYTEKQPSEVLNSTNTTRRSHTTTNSGSSYNTRQDKESSKSLIELNDDTENLQSGQILTILNDCYAFRMRLSDKEYKEQQSPPSPSPSPSPSLSSSLYYPVNWMREKTKLLLSKKRKSTASSDAIPSENSSSTAIPKKAEPYLKCRTQQGNIVYIFLHEPGAFSPIHYEIKDSNANTNTETNLLGVSGVLGLKDILSNFRLPVSVHVVDGLTIFDSINSTTSVSRDESSISALTKLRLLMPYDENVVFAHPLLLHPQKSHKPSSSSIIIPLSVDADIEIQPCVNMSQISKTEIFQKLLEICLERIKLYRTEVSLINVPIKLKSNKYQQRPSLTKKRSQSMSYFDERPNDQLQPYDQNTNNNNQQSNYSMSFASAESLDRASTEASERKSSSSDKKIKPKLKLSEYHQKINQENQRKFSQDMLAKEDEMYKDVDKIYDYIRTGAIMQEVEIIQAKQQTGDSTPIINISSSTPKESERQNSSEDRSLGTMIAHRFSPKVNVIKTFSIGFEVQETSTNDGNVNDEQARALFLASKHRLKPN